MHEEGGNDIGVHRVMMTKQSGDGGPQATDRKRTPAEVSCGQDRTVVVNVRTSR